MANETLMRANCRQGRLTITDGELFVAPRVPVVSRPRWSTARGEIAGLSVCPGHGVTLGLAFRTRDGRELHADWLLPHDAQRAAAILGYHYSLQELRELAAEMALGGEADVELIALAPEDVEPASAIRIVANSGPPHPAALPALPPTRPYAEAQPSHVAVLLAGAAAWLAIASIALVRLLTALLAGISALIERATPATHALRRQVARLAPILAPAGSALRRAALHGRAALEPIWLPAARGIARSRPTLRLPYMGRRRFAGVGLALACLFSMIVAAAFGGGAHVPPAKSGPHNELTQLLPHILPTPTATALPTATPVPTRVPTPTPTPRPQPTPAPPPAALTLAITCASGMQNGLGLVCAHTHPGAALTITVTYCDGRKASGLGGTVHADANGNYTWRWKVQTRCAGPAVARVTATWNGQTVTTTATFIVRP
jgi:hypothetical protein